jgi:hypothetical protein
MLMRYIPLDDELSCGDGLWTRDRLEGMDARFVAAVELAFAKGLESRAAAAATVRVGYREAVIEAAWRYLLVNMDEGKDVTFAEVLSRCPGVSPERVREGIKRRLFSWIEEVR